MTRVGGLDRMRAESRVQASIVIPAHNEERTIARLLTTLGAAAGLEVIVVCNGCSDATVNISRGFAPDVSVIDLAEASKWLALRRGDEAATVPTRVYVDADVEISAPSIHRLLAAFDDPAILAAAPRRVIPREGVSTLVGWYYDVWEQLPQVAEGLFGRGVIALSENGNARVRALPRAMSDDLVMSEAFESAERRIVMDAEVVVRPPKTLRDLLHRRVRSATGNAEADAQGLRTSAAKTSLRSLGKLIASKPRLAPRIPVYLAISAAAKVAAQRAVRSGDFSTWLRDESSRE